jgi:Tfp pilus assembly protein PilV
MKNHSQLERHNLRQRGITLVETMIACVVLLVGFVGTMSLFSVAVVRNSTKGEIGTLVTEYAQDKMEQMMALSYSDATSNTTVYPSQATGGTGLGGVMAGNQTIGSVDSSAPAAGYVDYLDRSGDLLTSSTGAYFIRQWSITTNAAGNLKTITVLARAAYLPSLQGAPPAVTVVCSRTNS